MLPSGGGPAVRLVHLRRGAVQTEVRNIYRSSRASLPRRRSVDLNAETKFVPNRRRLTQDALNRDAPIRNAKPWAGQLPKQTAGGKHQGKNGPSIRSSSSRAEQISQQISKAKHEGKHHVPEGGDTAANRSLGMTWLTDSPELLVRNYKCSRSKKLLLTPRIAQKPEDLLRQVMKYCHRNPNYRSIVLLATPGLAHFMDRDVFLRPLLENVYSKSIPHSGTARMGTVRTSAAIVDALPVPQSKKSKSAGQTSEGIALLLTEDFSQNWRMSGKEQDASETEANHPGTIAFLSEASRTISPPWRSNCTLTLPLANTLFLNGQQHTMVCDQWGVPTGYLETRPLLQSTEKLQHLSVHLHYEPMWFFSGQIPLQALTREREITQFMGNILAKIEVDGVSVPASQELESAVTKFVASNPYHGPVAVYALIRPPNIDDESPSVQRLVDDGVLSLVASALCRGAKLHKVTGGGGGWGEKAGLLSIDAADSLSSVAKVTMQFPVLEDDVPGPATPKPNDIIEKGSTVEFFVYIRERPSEDTVGVDEPEETAMQRDRAITWVLGTTSHPEALSRPVDAETELNHPRGVTFLPDYFGMLTCGNAALKVSKSLDMDQNPPLEISTWDTSHKRWRSRIDVPDSRFIFKPRHGFRSAVKR